jgi:lipid A 3-O-deacylase
MHRILRYAAAGALLTLVGAGAAAQDPAAEPKAIGTLQVENDLFANTDRHYTSGVRLSYLGAEADVPDWVGHAADAFPLFSPEGKRRVGFALGQSMYTPKNLSRTPPDPRDEPYAGWLYGSVGLVSENGGRLDELELDLGVVGPDSLAEPAQKFIHHLTGAKQPLGWRYQLHDEPGAMLTYQRKWRGLVELSPFGLGVDFTPYAGGTAGNVLTQAVAGGVFRIGFDLPADYGPPRIRPSLTGSDYFRPQRAFGWYLFAGVESRAVARNIFLDGNSFRSSPHVDKKPLVGDAEIGVAATLGGVRIAYSHVFSTKEFYGQVAHDTFGSFSFSVLF